jgi:uncharacterized protein
MDPFLPPKPKKRRVRILKWFLPGLLLVAAVFFFVYVPYFFARVVVVRKFHFHDKLDGQTPATYQLAYRDMEFSTSDGIRLKGWFVPAEKPKGTVVFVHGLNRTRVEMLPEAIYVHRLAYNALLFDERHSGASDGTVTSLGYYERWDVEAAVREAEQLQPPSKTMIVWGVSMGAAAALMAAKETPAIDASICDSTFLTLRDTAYHHLKLFLHLPRFPTAMTAVKFMEHMARFSADDFDLRSAVDQIGDRPILFVSGGADNRMPPSIARVLFLSAHSKHKILLEVPGARHGEAFRTNSKLYESAVSDFLNGIQK